MKGVFVENTKEQLGNVKNRNRRNHSRRKKIKNRAIKQINVLKNNIQSEELDFEGLSKFLEVEKGIARSTRNRELRTKNIQGWPILFCKKCNTLLKPGVNSRVRIKNKKSRHISVTCLLCNEISRIKIKKKDSKI